MNLQEGFQTWTFRKVRGAEQQEDWEIWFEIGKLSGIKVTSRKSFPQNTWQVIPSGLKLFFGH